MRVDHAGPFVLILHVILLLAFRRIFTPLHQTNTLARYWDGEIEDTYKSQKGVKNTLEHSKHGTMYPFPRGNGFCATKGFGMMGLKHWCCF